MAKRSTVAALTSTAFTTAIQPEKHNLNLSVSGTWVGIITLQRSFNNGSNWFNVESYTTNTEKVIEDPEDGVTYRVGFTVFTSGTANVRLSV